MGTRISEAARGYQAPDGLLSLEPGNSFPPYGADPDGERLMTCDNDNGILFLTYLVRLLHLRGELHQVDRYVVERILRRLESPLPGKYRRNPGRDDADHHDNPAGIAALAWLFALWTPIRRQTAYLAADGFTFGGKVPWLADACYHALLARPANGMKSREPTWFEVAALCAASIHTFGALSPLDRSSEWLLGWLMIGAAADSASVDAATHGMNPRKAWMLRATERLCRWLCQRRTRGQGIQQAFAAYFAHPQHPCRFYSAGIVW